MATSFNFLAPPNQNELGAAFGYYPQIRRNRMYQDPQAALEMPVQLARGRVAATVGAIPDFLNTVRSPMPMEMFGQVDYGPQTQVPYGSQELLKTLPLAPQGPAQQAAAQLGALAPMTPAEALQAARLVRQAALAGRGLPVGMGTEAVGGMGFLNPQPAVMSKAEDINARLLSAQTSAPANALSAKREYVEPSTPTNSTMQVGNREVPVTMYPSEAKQGNKIVNVDPAAFDAQFAKNENFYVGKGGEGGIGNRYDKFVDWIKDAPSMNASNVSVSNNGSVMFGDGRHRYAGLRDLGVSSIPVSMDAKSIANAKKFGLLAK
jgi:hypothetical protein